MTGKPTLRLRFLLDADPPGGPADFSAMHKDEDRKADDGSDLYWVQVLQTGPIPKYDDFEITTAHLAAMVDEYGAHLEQYPAQHRPGNYFHNPRKPEVTDPGSKVATGWTYDLETRADGHQLWALVDWTPKALEHIQGKEFRYISAEVSIGEKSASFAGFAITNDPAVLGMATTFEAGPPAEDETPMTIPLLVLTALSLSEDATAEDAVLKIDGLKARVPTGDVVTLERSRLATLKAKETQLTALLEKQAEDEAKGFVATARDEHRILPAEEPKWLAFTQKHGTTAADDLMPAKGTHTHLFESNGDDGQGNGEAPEGGLLTFEAASAKVAELKTAKKTDAEIEKSHPAVWKAYTNRG